MTDFYINKIGYLLLEINKIKNEKFISELITELRRNIDCLENATDLNDVFNIIVKQDKNIMREFVFLVKNHLSKEKSAYSIEKLGIAISHGSCKGDAGLCVLTKFKCKICEEEKMNGNSNIPSICFDCGKEIAERIILRNERIEKGE